MSESFFISYSSVDSADFAIKLADELESGPPSILVWLDKRDLRLGEDWDEQIAEAIRTCKGMIFVMSIDSVRPDSVCKNEWVRALKYKKPLIPILLTPDVEVPFRLGSREYTDFTESFDPALARLRKQLIWMDSPAGQLQALKYRLSDAQRELPRSKPEQQARIREDIAELETEIAQQQRIINDPKFAQQRVQDSIKAGLEVERKPSLPVGGITPGKFINPPPLVAPSWFQNRDFETRQIGEFLKDESLRLMTIVGRGGIGKSALVCRLLRSLEGGLLPDGGRSLTVDGIVYLSHARSFHRVTVPDLYAGLTKLVSDEVLKQLDAVYKNPHAKTRTIMEALTRVFATGRTIVLMDNFEDTLAPETAHIQDSELDEALRALLELPPHGLKVILTTRIAPAELAMSEPGRQRRLDLDTGLDYPYAENILKAMDIDGKIGLRDAPEALLTKARERTLGYPRALEHLFGILSADRNTSLQDMLDNTELFLPEKVIAVLVGEAFSRLDLTAQRVVQALASCRYPVPPAAVDYLLQPYVPGIESGRILSRLLNMQFVRRDSGQYYLHQVDRDYAVSRVTEGVPSDREAEAAPLTRFALQHRAAEWFKLSRKPRESWKTLDDLVPQLSEFELRCEGENYDTAAAVLLEFDFDYLFLWGHYRLMTELHTRLYGKITDPRLAQKSVGNLGSAYYRMGQVQKAMTSYEEALRLAQENHNRRGEGTWLGNLGLCIGALGQNYRAIGYHKKALKIHREVKNRRGESVEYGNLAKRYGEIGQFALATKHVKQALLIDREINDRESEAADLLTLSDCSSKLGLSAEALDFCSGALDIARNIGARLAEAYSHATMGEFHMSQDDWIKSSRALEQAITIADDIGATEVCKESREKLALVKLCLNEVSEAQRLMEAAIKYDVPLNNHSTLALLGVVTLRQGDVDSARKAFTDALKEATTLATLTPHRYQALDVQGLSLCGLALCGDLMQVGKAKAAYKAARMVTSAAGVVRLALQLFDTLAPADTKRILVAIRSIVSGAKPK
jgi:tetratricopeptide (TPR) repeat protein